MITRFNLLFGKGLDSLRREGIRLTLSKIERYLAVKDHYKHSCMVKYQANIDLTNKNNSHTLCFDYIQDIAKGKSLSILEVGCSSGYLGSVLIDNGHNVWGIEPNREAAKYAKYSLDNVFVGTVEQFVNLNLDCSFDIILFGDVLEHLLDPTTVLTLCMRLLKQNGSIVASMPNITHYTIRAMLLEGRWNYSEFGILDRTHLRFYCKSSIVKMFNHAGYNVDGISAVKIAPEIANALFEMNLSKYSIKTVKKFAKDSTGMDFQYVLQATAKKYLNETKSTEAFDSNEEGLRVVCILGNTNSSLVDIRLRNPLRSWAKEYNGHLRVLNVSCVSDEQLSWGDVFVFQREVCEYTLKLMQILKEAGKKIVYELDDYLLEFPYFLSHHALFYNKIVPYIIQAIRIADVVSVSTVMLGQAIEEYNNSWYCTPNYSIVIDKPSTHFEVLPDKVSLIIASSDKVLVDFLIEPLKLIQNKYGVKIIGIGPPADVIADAGLIVDKINNMPHLEFKTFIASIDNAIGIIPLDDSRFSSCKSAVKYFDYSLAGIPTICSDVLPYNACITNFKDGVLSQNNCVSWYEKIEQLLLDADIRISIANEAFMHVKHRFTIRENIKAWNEIFTWLSVDTYNRSDTKIVKPLVKIRCSIVFLFIIRNIFNPALYEKVYRRYKDNGKEHFFR